MLSEKLFVGTMTNGTGDERHKGKVYETATSYRKDTVNGVNYSTKGIPDTIHLMLRGTRP